MAIALVSNTSAAGLNGATTSAIDTTGASLLVIMVAYGAAITVSDSKGNTWTALTAQTQSGQSGRIYYAWNATVGTGHTFTVAGASSASSFEVAAYSGVLASADPFDVQQGGVATGVTVAGIGAGTLTPSQNDSLVIAGVTHGAAITSFAAQAGFTTTNQVNFSGGVNYGSAQGYIVQTTATAIPNSTAVSSWTTAVTVTVQSAVFKPATGGGGLAAGVASQSSSTNTTINMTCGAATGGTAPYTYQWYRSTTSDFTIGAPTLLSGATSLTLADSASLLADTPYYYQLRATDAVAGTADSNQAAGILKAAPLRLGFIGDSITFGFGLSGGQSPPEQIVSILSKTYKNRLVTATNSAVSGSRTSQWVSGSSNLNTAKSAFASASVTHVHIMLGANDAAASNLVSVATYKSNLQNIIADLSGAGYTVILSYPTYIPAGANGNATTAASVALAQSYQTEIDSLIDGTTVLRGDQLSFNYFISNLSEYQSDKTHPTATGAISLATMWARAIDRSLLDAGDGPVGTKTATVTFEDRNGQLRANLSGLKWRWSDSLTTLESTGTGATTNGAGVFSVTVNTNLPSGGIGYLEVSNTDGDPDQATQIAFFGAVEVA
jgi:lysophospholipase L1-like esterase